jgi:anti-sigma B factor antagonist
MMTLLEQRKIDTVTVVDLAGKITFGDTANSMLETVSDLLGRGEKKIIFNFAKVHYIDSAGLGVLVKCRNAARTQQGLVKLINLPTSIRELMRITNLTSLFEISDDETAAVINFQ